MQKGQIYLPLFCVLDVFIKKINPGFSSTSLESYLQRC